MSEPRTVTLSTTDHGDVTIPEPSWCAGHAGHIPDPLSDILHCGPPVVFSFRGLEITDACIVQSPFSTTEIPELCSSTPGVSVSVIARTLDPAGLYELAAAFDGYADRLRALADELTAILAGGGR
ncbi:DUF6907 domain-containing protein [Streptomyces variabilis]